MSSLARQEHTGGSEVQDIEHGNRSQRNRVRRRLKDSVVGFVNTHPSTGKYLLTSLILVSVSLDPLFFYIPVVNNDLNCLGLDDKLRIIVVVFRTFIDAVYTILMWRYKELLSHRTGDIHVLDFLSRMAVVIALMPLPQVVVYAVTWRLRPVKLLKFIVLIQFAPRAYVIKLTYKYARLHSRSIKTWLAAACYLLLFILASNVLGAFWYLRTIERNIDCWRKACKTRGLCGVSSLYCDNSSSNNGYLDEFCLMPPSQNSTFFDHGIYLDAFQREIIGIHTNFFNKLFYCLWWGLQNLSSLGQNLKPGTYIWDNFFAIFIVISGLVLLALLIGNMQVYLQKEAASDVNSQKIKEQEKERKKERMARMKEALFCWPPFRSFPHGTGTKVLKCEDEEWLRTTEINLETLLNNIRPPAFRKELRRELSKDLFSKVKKFEELSEDVKKDLRARAKVVIFEARSTIYTAGHPIYEMIHIVNGKVLVFRRDRNKKKESLMHICNLGNDDSLGKELLDKALESPEPNLPLAAETIQTLTKVEAFALSFDDFSSVFTRHGKSISSYQKIWSKNELGKKNDANTRRKISSHEA